MKRKEERKRNRICWLVMSVLLLLGGMMTGCTDYQDEVDSLDRRVTTLEELIKRANSDLETMEAFLAAIEEGDYITGVRETDDGYVINFKKAGPMYIHDGIDGIDGKDAQMPDVDVVMGEDGYFYWVIDGVVLKGPDGNPVRVNGKDGRDGRDGVDGKDGKDGRDGRDGKDAMQPELRINPETGFWEVSLDDGLTWTSTGSPAQGKDGKDGNEFFVSVNYEVTAEGEFMTITTKSGQTFRIPIYKNA